jgi:hypothetical protein
MAPDQRARPGIERGLALALGVDRDLQATVGQRGEATPGGGRHQSELATV